MSKKVTQSEIPGAGDPDINVDNGMQAYVPGQASGLEIQQASLNQIDALENAKVIPVDLSATYWTPEVPGESKRVIFDYIGESQALAQDGSGELITLETAYFLTKEDGTVKRICNASKRLVGALQNMKQYSALEIKYLGKKQNRNNPFKSDSWSIMPLQIDVKS